MQTKVQKNQSRLTDVDIFQFMERLNIGSWKLYLVNPKTGETDKQPVDMYKHNSVKSNLRSMRYLATSLKQVNDAYGVKDFCIKLKKDGVFSILHFTFTGNSHFSVLSDIIRRDIENHKSSPDKFLEKFEFLKKQSLAMINQLDEKLYPIKSKEYSQLTDEEKELFFTYARLKLFQDHSLTTNY